MTNERIYIAVSLEPDHDEPVADIVYDGYQWASATLDAGELRLTLYGEPGASAQIPIDDAIASLEEAKRQLGPLDGRA